jgi:hypothetical protein
LTTELRNELDEFTSRLAENGQIDAIVRMRALNEISESLTTDQLLKLVVRIANAKCRLGGDRRQITN